MKQAEIRILLVDDHRLFREGVRKILEMHSGFIVVGECGDGQEAVAMARNLRPDIVLMDINMPSLNGVEATSAILEASPESRIIILSIHDDEQYVYRTLRNGASGYLLKEVETESLIEAVEAVAEGGSYVHHKVTGKLIDEFRRLCAEGERMKEEAAAASEVEVLDRSVWESLTPRERDVLELMAAGNNNRAIGDRLFISEKTVKNHVSSILLKMGVEDRTQAVIRAIKSGWIHL
jgi:DNA-binding NarL/FixJ family response regulator